MMLCTRPPDRVSQSLELRTVPCRRLARRSVVGAKRLRVKFSLASCSTALCFPQQDRFTDYDNDPGVAMEGRIGTAIALYDAFV